MHAHQMAERIDPVSGAFSSSEFTLFFRGCISDVSEIGFKIAQYPGTIKPPRMRFEGILDYGFIRRYELQGLADLPESERDAVAAAGAISGITITLASGAHLTVIERRMETDPDNL